jgi:hypothetical protein
MKAPKWIDARPEIRRLTKVEAAWIAAVIDGEGSIGLYDYGKEGRRVQIQLGNTSEAFVQRFRDLIGCGSTVFRVTHGGSHKGRQPMYHYTLKGSARCYRVLKQVLPFLIIKHEKAQRIIGELESRPFGRWANATPEARAQHSARQKAAWADPPRRARRLAGMREAQLRRKRES